MAAFFACATALSVAPGVPAALRPLDAATPEARAALASSVFARPRLTLVEHERLLAGEAPALDGDASADAIPKDDDDGASTDSASVDGASTDGARRRERLVRGDEPRVAPRDRAAFLDSFPATREDHAAATAQAQLGMPGALVENPCVERTDDGACRRTALDPFFSTLDALVAGDTTARAGVVVLGNSLIASDHVIDVVRDVLVERFGDGGRGLLLPERVSKEAGRRVRTGRGTPGWTPRTFALDEAIPVAAFGLTGSFHEASSDGEATIWTADGATLGRLRWLDDGRPIRVEVDGVEVLRIDARRDPVGRARARSFPIVPGARAVRLVAGRGARVVDVVLERNAAGVVVDTIGVPAATVRSFVERTDTLAFVTELRERDPAMVVLMLGGNETRAMSAGALDEDTFADALTRLLDRIHAAAPRSACLVVAPIDSAKARVSDGALSTRPETQRIVDVQRRVSATAGCAFFDLFAAMGGDGALARMDAAGLVSDDRVHPRVRGANLLGDLLSRALLSSWRTTPAPTDAVVFRRRPDDPQRPRFVGLSFPEEDRVVVGSGAPVAEDDVRARPRALARFFARLSALEDGRRSRVAIGQLGASHTAGQMLTDRIRQRLGARFGEVGRGYVAAGTASKRLTPSGVFRDVTGAFDVADGREVRSGGAVGMAGTKLRLAPGSRFRIGFCSGCPVDSNRTRGTLGVSWLYTPDMGTADVLVDGVRVASLSPTSRRVDTDVQLLTLPIADERATLDIVVRNVDDVGEVAGVDGSSVGPVHLLSVAEEMQRRGIVLDAAGLPGTTGMTAQRWRQDLLAEEVRARDYDLIITAWGTNEAGLTTLDEATYRRHFGATLDTLLAAAPDADCLVLGASDRFDRRGNVLVPAPAHDLVERVQRSLAAERACAFFSLRDVMGGPGSMRRWVGDGLARNDHVHFTREGYGRLADAFVDELLAAYAWSASDPARLGVEDDEHDKDDDDDDEEEDGDRDSASDSQDAAADGGTRTVPTRERIERGGPRAPHETEARSGPGKTTPTTTLPPALARAEAQEPAAGVP
jgi:lysophospholipase L1-like esterase